jgi:hypothetical protein
VLHDLLARIPAEDRLLVISLAGVHNWRQNSEWTSLDFRPSSTYTTEAWVAFDGDLAENRQVWDATRMLMDYLVEKKKVSEDEVKILDMTGLRTKSGDKVGVDDFLAEHGTYIDLVGTATTELPERPAIPDEDLIGQWRMNDTGTILQQCVRPDPESRARWVEKVYMGGRLRSIQQSRAPSDQEESTWVRGRGVEPEDTEVKVEIEISWLQGSETGVTELSEDSDAVMSAVITGPAQLLSLAPSDWLKAGAIIPVEVQRHVEWPPRKFADEWMRAMKAHDSDRTIDENRWMTMGWVPTDRPGDPVFIVGTQVIDAQGGSTRAKPGIGERELSGATSLSVLPMAPRTDEETRRETIRRSLETVLERFLVDGPWKNPDIGKLMLAASLRPAIPLRPVTSIYMVGQAGSGKALPLDTVIPVPSSRRFPEGRARVGDIRVDDRVFGSDGEVTRVRATTRDHRARAYDLHLSDGRIARMTDRHIVKVSSTSTRSLSRLGASRHIDASTSSLVDALRRAARQVRSGESGRVEDVAAGYGLSQGALERAAEAARLPSMTLLAPDRSQDATEQTAYASAEVSRALDGHISTPVGIAEAFVPAADLAGATGLDEDHLHRLMTGGGVTCETRTMHPHRPARVYPTGELLAALADLIECGVHGRTTRWFSLSAEEVAARVHEGLELPSIDPAGEVRSVSTVHRAGQAAGEAAVDGEHVEAVELMVANPSSSDRATFAAGFRIGAQRRMARQGILTGAVPGEEDHALYVPDPNTRDAVVALLRSIGRSPRSARDGYILYSASCEPVRITRAVPVASGQVEAKCLTVDASDGMFCTDGFVLTHNSWTASTAMVFWQTRPTWDENHLPGSAQDTPAATEHALNIAPIWVVDDLAPSPDQRKAASDQGKIGEIIRSVHNSSGKRRSGADMTQRAHRRPKALLIATAENELPIASAMARTICLTLPKGSLRGEAMSAMTRLRSSPEAPRVTAALIQYLASKVYLVGPDADTPVSKYWESRRNELKAMAVSIAVEKNRFVKDSFDRQAKMIADLMLVIAPLRDLALTVGVGRELVDLLRTEGDGTVGEGISNLSLQSHRATSATSPGLSLVRALKWVLAGTRSGYISNGSDPASPPFTARDGSESEGDTRTKNMALGWSYKAGEPTPNGERLGVAFERNGAMIIHFDMQTAFNVAKRSHGDLIPHGSTARTAWGSVWAAGLGIEGEYGIGERQSMDAKKGEDGKSSKRNSLSIMIGGVKTSGVPILFETLMDADVEPDGDDAEDFEDEDVLVDEDGVLIGEEIVGDMSADEAAEEGSDGD